MTFLAGVGLVLGGFFAVAGVAGYLRFPDLYTRAHAAGKVGVFAAGLFFLAAATGVPHGGGRGLLGALLLWLAGPVATHAIARAAKKRGLTPKTEENRP
jgi:multicomponent Na+:H+ antiporter subunit G